MRKTTPIFSVLIPAYKAEGIIGATIKSIQNQTFADFELIIVDDNSPDNTEGVIKKFQKQDERIKYFRNEKNLGYSGNLKRCRELATGEYIYLMGNDDILSKYALEKTLSAFKMDSDVGVVTRPYYWFENNEINQAVRVVTPLDKNADRLISIFDGKKVFCKVLESVGQLSGLAYKRIWMTEPIHPDIFPAHIYPFLAIFREHKAVFLKDYILAVRIFSSQTRSLSSIYEPSPTFTWARMFKKILKSKKFQKPRKWGIEHIALNYDGLIQMKNYARFPLFFKEVGFLIKYRPKNLLSLKFWFYVIGLTFVPRFLLIPMVDKYKKKIISRKISKIKLDNKR
ncbi:MAG: GalNAc(5)-diNAcBac-PP-undecaprenol beta-1,3-glucosyltransferase [candidate division WS2 bacterium ADurb.Bin280]|uniref:GalNAc(5)-diNAcBac-PP-undecaprenol beta-1,3-glucosyltransferase n=1 Tax=candidate division WS2 bacterium ADurb.Bin280 TaxID=1852829 RepID=A0A1V5SCN6_9BACT|nr:MAG: GalNAc(5)-diNAcBac-PP-undecaprenol beta-1,3-glucosyltransferase [candidate division WS2 bacterium ADurb.Bin280]